MKGSALVNPAAATGLRLGRQYGSNGKYWSRRIADVRVWNRDLGYSEVGQRLADNATDGHG